MSRQKKADFSKNEKIATNISKKMHKDVYMLTIDSSTKKTGIAVWKNAKYVDRTLINLDPDDHKDKSDPLYGKLVKMEDRFPYMIDAIFELLNKYKPQIVYMEEEVVQRNMDGCRFLFRVMGAVHGWCLCNDCEFTTVRPTVWRKTCGILQGKNRKRDELKKQALDFVERYLWIDGVNDDEAEAICIGYYVLDLFGIKFSKLEDKA